MSLQYVMSILNYNVFLLRQSLGDIYFAPKDQKSGFQYLEVGFFFVFGADNAGKQLYGIKNEFFQGFV